MLLLSGEVVTSFQLLLMPGWVIGSLRTPQNSLWMTSVFCQHGADELYNGVHHSTVTNYRSTQKRKVITSSQNIGVEAVMVVGGVS